MAVGKKTGGRRPGSGNIKTKALKDAGEKLVAEVAASIPDAFEGDAHALLVSVYKDPGHALQLRIDAAKAAIRYEKPALANIEANVTGEMIINGRVRWQPAK